MDVAGLFLHNARNGACPGWVIEGADIAETAAIDSVFGYYINLEQDAGFNEWHIWKSVYGNEVSWSAKRYTWDNPHYERDLESLLAFVHKVYATYPPEWCWRHGNKENK